MTLIKITAKEINKKYCGTQGGYIKGAHYAILEEGKGIYSFDGKMPYMLKGPSGKAAMESIIAAGGFLGSMKYVSTI